MTLTKQLRKLLPRADGYSISHAPQAPYFDLGYGDVHKQAGDDIDYYTVQFYNQGNYYVTNGGLVDHETIVPDPKTPSCVNPWDGSIADLVKHGVPASKIVVGKMVTSGDGNSGYVAPSELVGMLRYALGKYPTLGGAMGWQWGSDTKGDWIAQLAKPFAVADKVLEARQQQQPQCNDCCDCLPQAAGQDAFCAQKTGHSGATCVQSGKDPDQGKCCW